MTAAKRRSSKGCRCLALLIVEQLTYSTDSDLSAAETTRTVSAVETMVRRKGLRLNKDKQTIARAGDRKVTTKLLVNAKTALPTAQRSAIRSAVAKLRQTPEAARATPRYEHDYRQVSGKVGYLQQHNPNEAAQLRTILRNLQPTPAAGDGLIEPWFFMSTSSELQPQKPCRILSLDGGGAKGFYTLGVLKQVEALLGGPLYEHFDLIFGTSTGAIIAALLALGHSVDEVHTLYRTHVPSIMRKLLPRHKTAALVAAAEEVFGDKKFTDVKTGVGIVATRWVMEKPMIFKTSVEQAHGREATFKPGFGCTIAKAVQASCSAYPFFKKTIVTTDDGPVELIDGGYCANNPTLYALADAVAALQRDFQDIRLLSVGVGEYPEPRKWTSAIKSWYFLAQLLQKTLNVNTHSMEQLRAILFKRVQTVRISDKFDRPEMATDLMESDLGKLTILYQEGGESFAKHEEALKILLDKQQPQAPKARPS